MVNTLYRLFYVVLEKGLAITNAIKARYSAAENSSSFHLWQYFGVFWVQTLHFVSKRIVNAESVEMLYDLWMT